MYARPPSTSCYSEKSNPKITWARSRHCSSGYNSTCATFKDPFRVEVLHSAKRLLELRAGDCDDMAILLGAMLEAIGHPVRLVLTGPDPLRKTSLAIFIWRFFTKVAGSRWTPPCPTRWAGPQEHW